MRVSDITSLFESPQSELKEEAVIEVEGISYSYVGKDPVIDRAIVNAWKKGCTAMKFGSYGLMGIPVLIIMVIFTDMTWSFAIVFLGNMGNLLVGSGMESARINTTQQHYLNHIGPSSFLK